MENKIIMPTFETISEIVNDAYFIEFVTKNLSDLKTQKGLRSQAPAGFNYKKDWMDKMNTTPSYFISSIEAIWLKTSKLSRAEREIIGYICDKSFIQTLAYYKEINTSALDNIPDDLKHYPIHSDCYTGEELPDIEWKQDNETTPETQESWNVHGDEVGKTK
jgi:hypothetical protein